MSSEVAAPSLEARGVSLRLGETDVLDRVDLSVAPGEIVALVGPSGCGKSTLLGVLAGLSEPDAGEVLLDGAPARGRLGRLTLMPQRDALLPWRTLLDNVALAPALAGAPPDEAARAARAALARFGLSGFARPLPARALGRDAPARRAGPHAAVGIARLAARRALRRARRPHPRRPPGRARGDLGRAPPHGAAGDARPRRGPAARRPGARGLAPADADRRRDRGQPPAPARASTTPSRRRSPSCGGG